MQASSSHRSGWRRGSISIGPPQKRNPEAVAAWQEGNDLLALNPHTAVSDRGIPVTLQRALERYEFAVARDSGFARAWASLAEAYDYAAAYVGRDANQDESRAEAAARRAIALDAKSAAGYAILGLTLMSWRWNWAEAETAYRRALALDPRSAYAVVEFVDLLRQTGRWNEAENELRKARALLPALPVLTNKQAELELDRGRFERGYVGRQGSRSGSNRITGEPMSSSGLLTSATVNPVRRWQPIAPPLPCRAKSAACCRRLATCSPASARPKRRAQCCAN